MVEVGCAEAAVPEVGRGVLVRDEEDGEGGVGGEDGVRGGRVVFAGVSGEGFRKGGSGKQEGGVSVVGTFCLRAWDAWGWTVHEVCMLRLEGV